MQQLTRITLIVALALTGCAKKKEAPTFAGTDLPPGAAGNVAPSAQTAALNASVRERLPLDDPQDFENAKRGLIARDAELRIAGRDGANVFAHEFLSEKHRDVTCSHRTPTVNDGPDNHDATDEPDDHRPKRHARAIPHRSTAMRSWRAASFIHTHTPPGPPLLHSHAHTTRTPVSRAASQGVTVVEDGRGLPAACSTGT